MRKKASHIQNSSKFNNNERGANMNAELFAKQLGFNVLCLPSPEKDVHGAYAGDLLSWVMGRANAECAWITIMSNINIVAVASLTDVSCIVLAEGVTLADDIVATASDKGVNIFSTSLPAYEACVEISNILK